MENVILGIDLGTTFSSVAYINEKGFPEVIRNADGKTSTPSVVLIQDGQVAVGDVALNQWATNDEHVVRWIKRAMGAPGYTFQGMSAVEISAEILKSLKADAEAWLGRACDEAVITCPAYFAALEIENTRKAGELAGFNVKEIIKEPTAAAVYYGIENMADGERILVCDLGGGTFDATLLAYEKGVFIPLASAGSRVLGGYDWTMDLVALVTERFIEQFGEDPTTDLVASQLLHEACESAKRDFSQLERVSIPCGFQGRSESFIVTRDEFEQRTEWRMTQLVMFTEDCLRKAQKTWGEVNKILMVGGSSRLRRMRLALEENSGIKPVMSRDPDLSVALGAAILASGKVRRKRGGLVEGAAGGLIEEVQFKRIIARSLGTRAAVIQRGEAPRIACSLIIPHSTEAPVTRARDDFEISRDGQPYFNVPVVEFESDSDFDPVDNFRFTCRPGARKGERICITFHYDINGIPTVEARDVKTGQPLAGERLPYEEPDLSKIGSFSVKPRWVVFAIDTSGSMSGEKLENARRALIENARRLFAMGGEGIRVGVVSFSTNAEVVCLPTNDLNRLERAVNGLQVTGLTSMDEGIELAVQIALTAPPDTNRDVIMLTDGMPDENRRQRTVYAAHHARDAGIILSSIGIGQQDVDLEFLQALSPNFEITNDSADLSTLIDGILTLSEKQHGGITD